MEDVKFRIEHASDDGEVILDYYQPDTPYDRLNKVQVNIVKGAFYKKRNLRTGEKSGPVFRAGEGSILVYFNGASKSYKTFKGFEKATRQHLQMLVNQYSVKECV